MFVRGPLCGLLLLLLSILYFLDYSYLYLSHLPHSAKIPSIIEYVTITVGWSSMNRLLSMIRLLVLEIYNTNLHRTTVGCSSMWCSLLAVSNLFRGKRVLHYFILLVLIIIWSVSLVVSLIIRSPTNLHTVWLSVHIMVPYTLICDLVWLIYFPSHPLASVTTAVWHCC